MMRNQLPTPSNEKNCRKFDYPQWRRPKKFLKIFFDFFSFLLLVKGILNLKMNDCNHICKKMAVFYIIEFHGFLF